MWHAATAAATAAVPAMWLGAATAAVPAMWLGAAVPAVPAMWPAVPAVPAMWLAVNTEGLKAASVRSSASSGVSQPPIGYENGV